MISSPRVLFQVSAAEAPYHKALQECVADRIEQAGFQAFHIALPDRQHAGNAEFAPDAARPAHPLIRLHLLPVRAFRKRQGNFLPSRKLWPLLKRTNPAVIWSHEYSLFNWPTLIFAIIRRRPLVISTEVGRSNLGDMGVSARLTRRIFGRFVSGIIANSPAAMQPCEAVGLDHVARAWHAAREPAENFIPPSNFDEEGRLRLVFVGHMIPRKGVDCLLNAMERAEQLGACFHLTLVGKSNAWSRQIVASFRGRSPITTAGFLEGYALRKTLADQDVFVLPSRYDTYGAVVHEAASAGLALLVSKNAGASALIEEERAAYVMDPEGTEDFALKLANLYRPDTLSRAKHSALLTARRNSAEFHSCRVVELIKLAMQPVHQRHK